MEIKEEGTVSADVAQFTPPIGGTQKRKLALDGSGPIAKKKKIKRFKDFVKKEDENENYR